MANFRLFIDNLLKLEEGYQDNPALSKNINHSGEVVGSAYGISAKLYGVYLNRPATVEDMKNLTEAKASDLHERFHWDRHRLSEFDNQKLAEVVCDGIIEHGPGSANQPGGISMLQRELNKLGIGTNVDGQIGLMTLSSVNLQIRKNWAELYNNYVQARIFQYYKKAESDPENSQFLGASISRMQNFPAVNLYIETVVNHERAKFATTGLFTDPIEHFFKGFLVIDRAPSAQREWGIALLVILAIFLSFKFRNCKIC